MCLDVITILVQAGNIGMRRDEVWKGERTDQWRVGQRQVCGLENNVVDEPFVFFIIQETEERVNE